ncbi:MAG: hypothetical protein NC408_09135 [Candidatus Gastranaerophilales bacterium]|nr:hypothetical protein [Candidatus Gastranaerophilales bacterium]MCM1073424.1 hypothetical protein [Bacteroides sp.]
MQINNTTSTNFNGYKNVLANRIVRPNGEKITYMSMQLDNIGKNDLEVWKYLQKNLMNRDFTTDVVTFNMFEQGNDNIIGFSSALLDLDDVEESSEEESLMMKAFTLLASLTDRIKSDFHLKQDENYRPMAYETKSDLADVFLDKKQSSAELDRAVWGAFYAETSPQEHAADINKKIHNKMMTYFS